MVYKAELYALKKAERSFLVSPAYRAEAKGSLERERECRILRYIFKTIRILLSYGRTERSPERFKAFSHVFDEGTLRAVFKVASTGQFEALLSPIKIGKEANLFTAKKGEDWRCVKVYRIASNFKKMFEYMAPDPRYAGLKRNKMSIINTWAIKEVILFPTLKSN